MALRRYVAGAPAVLRGCALLAGSLLAFSLLVLATGSHAEVGQRPQDPDRAVPTFESLPNAPLPAGDFHGWCGDKTVIWVDRRLLIYDGRVRSSPISFPSASGLYCDDDGQRVFLVDDEAGWPEKTGAVSEIDIASGAVTRKLAIYQKESRPIVSFSPNLRNVASTAPLTLASSAITLNAIQMQGSEARNILRIQWSRDSTELFVISQPKGQSNEQLVEIFNAQNKKIGSGPLPAGFNFRDGWFADSRTLYLYLGLKRDEFGSGVVFRCQIEAWKCVPIARNVLEASVGGDGMLGIVQAIGKYSNDGDWITFPSLYLVEIRNSASQVVGRQKFKSVDKDTFGLAISPSGTKAVLTWLAKVAPGCPPEQQKHSKCKAGIVIDLSGRPK